MDWTFLDTWIVVAGIISALACALLGNFLVLRRMSMMGDAISHAVLPGLAVAFLLTGSRESLPMFLGAAAAGILTALFTQWIHNLGRVEQSAAMGVVFTALFAAGLILLVRAADKVDLDPGCVLYGAIEMVPLDTRELFGWQVPRAVVTLGIVFLVDLAFIFVFFKELRISSFDPLLATTLGINARLMNCLLMTLVAVTTVAAFETAGSILVIAMLIVPAATAHLLTDRLRSMIVVSLLVAAASAGLGHVAAITVPIWFGFSDTNTAGMMAAVAGAFFGLTVLLAPRHGLISKAFHRAAVTLRVVQEDALGLLYRLGELKSPTLPAVTPAIICSATGASPALGRVALWRLSRLGMIARNDSGFGLTEAGRDEARGLVRSHRLWESFLHKHLNLPADHVHVTAERLEHITDSAMKQALAESTGQPARDPHGKQVPESRKRPT